MAGMVVKAHVYDIQGLRLNELARLTMYEIGSSGFCLTVRLMTSSIFLLSSANARQVFRSLCIRPQR